jgi:hypothetical protein
VIDLIEKPITPDEAVSFEVDDVGEIEFLGFERREFFHEADVRT